MTGGALGTQPMGAPHYALIAAVVVLWAGPASASFASGHRTSNFECLSIQRGDGNSPILSARINGHGPYQFILDTGSSSSTLDDRRVKILGLVRDSETEQGQAMGGPVAVQFYKIEKFQSGPLSVKKLIIPRVPAPDLLNSDIAGLAGVDLFEGRLLVWGRGASCVELGPSGIRPGRRGWSRAPSKWLKPWKILIPLRIGKTAGWGLLDTGAQTTVVSPAFAQSAGLEPAPNVAETTLSGLDGADLRLRYYVAPKIKAGVWNIRARRLAMGALPVFDRLGGANQALAVIGMDWLQGHRFAIDYGLKTVWQRP